MVRNKSVIRLSLCMISAVAILLLASPGLESAAAFHSRSSIESWWPGSLDLQERIAWQYAIEEVYWRHRIWPKENPDPKPNLAKVLAPEAIRFNVEDYLRKSDALEHYWQTPITPQQLQGELSRIMRDSRQPAVLRELFAALNNDATIIAECLARPILADRLIHNRFSGDERYHGALKQRIESELKLTNTVESMRALSGIYREITWRMELTDRRPVLQGALSLNPEQWRDALRSLRDQIGDLSVMTISRLVEEQHRYFVVAILEKSDTALKLAIVEWQKQAFEDWWAQAKRETTPEIVIPQFTYVLPNAPMDVTPDEDNTWISIDTGPPTERYAHSAIWTGAEMIIWGGGTYSESYNTGGRYNPATDTGSGGTSTYGAPAGRRGHSAIWTGTEMIVWGGGTDNGVPVNTGGRYNPTTNTWAAGGTSMTDAPSVRWQHVTVWTGTEMIVWGGWNNSSGNNTGGRYNPATNTWVAGGTSILDAPSPRRRATAVWTGSEMIVWGGWDSSDHLYQRTGGRYNPATNTWVPGGTNIPDAPDGRWSHTAIWTDGAMVVWGGEDSLSMLDTGGRYYPVTNTWALDGISTGNAPTPRYQHSMIWTGTEVIVWGGINSDYSAENTGGRYNPATNIWSVGGTSLTGAPMARYEHTAIWAGAEMIVWGGSTWEAVNSGGRYNPSTNTWIAGGTGSPGGPTARIGHTAVWTGTEMIVWGGTDRFGLQNTGGRYNSATDSWAAGGTSTSSAPAACGCHTAVWIGTEMIIWGGCVASGDTNAGGRYNPLTDTWASTSSTNAPDARRLHTAVWTGTEMIVWGGVNSGGYLNSGGRYNPGANTWIADGTSTTSAPAGRQAHTAIWTGSEMIIWGGSDDALYLNTGGRYNPANNTWTSTSTTNAPSERSGHTAIWTGSEMIVWGGFDGIEYLGTGWRFNPASNAWMPIGIGTKSPLPRSEHTAVWTGTEMIVWGGRDEITFFRSGGRYNLFLDTWKAGGTATINAPKGRYDHTAVWAGEAMIVWGGFDGYDYLDTGGSYYACLYCDDFEDSAQPNWLVIKPAFTETGGNYVGDPTGKKAEAVATPSFPGCRTCALQATFLTTGGPDNKVWMLGWYVDKLNLVEILINEEGDRVLMKQRINKVIVAKAKAIQTILPNTFYTLRADFDGTQFHLYLDGALILTLRPAGTVPTGTLGFRAKNTTVVIDEITVNGAGSP